MSRIGNNPFEELFKALTAQILAAAKEMAIGTVSSVSTTGIGITIDGDSSGAKKYTCNRAARFASGDRVLCARESGTWVVICKIGNPGGPVGKTTAMSQQVGVDADGKLWTEPPGAYNLPTASTSALGGIKTSEAYSSSKHTAKVAVDGSGVLYAEAYSLPIAGASTLGGVKPVAKTSAMTQEVGVDSSGKLYTTPPGAYNLPTASTSQIGGIKTSESYSSSKHTAKVAVNSSGVLYAEAYDLPTAGASTLGGVKPVAKTSAMTQDVGVDSSGKLYTKPGEGAYNLPTASTSALGGIKTSEAYSSTKHTLKVAVNSSGVLYAEAYDLPKATNSALGGVMGAAAYSSTKHTLEVAVDSYGKLHAEAPSGGNVSRLYAGTSTTYYAELNSSKVFAPNGTGFNLGSTSYPWQSFYFAKNGSQSYYLKAEASNIQPASTNTLSTYYNLGSSTYPFYALYVKKLYVDGKEVRPTDLGDVISRTPDEGEMWDGTTPTEETE